MALNSWLSCLPFRAQKCWQAYAATSGCKRHWALNPGLRAQLTSIVPSYISISPLILQTGAFTEPIRSSRNTKVCFPAALELQALTTTPDFMCCCGCEPRPSGVGWALGWAIFPAPPHVLQTQTACLNHGRKPTKLSEWHNCDLSSINILFANKSPCKQWQTSKIIK